MSAPAPGPQRGAASRPLVVDIIRAYEGVLLGLVIVILAAVLSGGGFGVVDFAAVLVLPAVLMLAFMHRGAPARRSFVLRASGALVGWALIWAVFIPLFIALSYAVFSAAAGVLVYVSLAIADGVILGLCITAVDRLGRRLGGSTSAEA